MVLKWLASWKILAFAYATCKKIINSSSNYFSTSCALFSGFGSIYWTTNVLYSQCASSINVLCKLFTFLFFSISLVRDEIRPILSSSSIDKLVRESKVDEQDGLVLSSLYFFATSLVLLSSSSFFSFSSLLLQSIFHLPFFSYLPQAISTLLLLFLSFLLQ